VGDRHLLDTNAFHEQRPAAWGEAGITVRHEGLLDVMCANTTFLEAFTSGQRQQRLV
jgi:hypothetical protein